MNRLLRRLFFRAVAPCVAFAAVAASSSVAHAGPYVGVDLDLGTAFQNSVDFSYGLGGRLGWKIYFPGAPVWLLPEVGAHFMSFGPNRAATEFSETGSVFGGARFGLDGIVQPNIFGHLGLAFIGGDELGPHADIGLGVDFQLTRVFSLGIQAAYNSDTIDDRGDTAKWVSFGINLGLDFTRRRRERVY